MDLPFMDSQLAETGCVGCPKRLPLWKLLDQRCHDQAAQLSPLVKNKTNCALCFVAVIS